MLQERIDQFYIDSFKERDQEHFYITDAGKCPRAVYFKFKKIPKKEPEPRVLRIFDNGDYTHMRIMSVLFGLGVVRATELKIPPQEIISGRADAIIDIEGKPYVLEIKSIGSYKFSKLQEPEPDHMKQVQLYMHFFKVSDGILLYEDKDKQNLKEFPVKYDPFLVQEALKKFKELKEQIDKSIVPPIPIDIEPWRCDYCDYQEECQKIEKRLKKDRGFDPAPIED